MKSSFKLFCTIAAISIFECITACNKEIKENKPELTSVVPSSARGGDTITAFGKNLFTDISKVKVTINKKEARIITATPDSIQAVVPENAGSGRVSVSIGDETYEGPEFEYEYKVIVTTVAGTGTAGNKGGSAATATFNCPWGIVSDRNNNLFIADVYSRLIRKISLADSTVINYEIGNLDFASPYNIAIDHNTGNLFVTDFNKHVMKMDQSANMSVIYTAEMPLAGIAVSPNGSSLFIGNNTLGTITKTDINGMNPVLYTDNIITPRNIFYDHTGKMWVACYRFLYDITNSGTATPAYAYGDFGGWEAIPDTAGNFYLADHFKNCIHKIDKAGNITKIAGSGMAADIDGIGLEASFNGPQGITIDADGNLYVTTFNYDTNEGNKVRKIEFK
ncbi:hypothetical protein DC498_04670 [Terrimonas sp.]|uniref:IPT/TIG domain-containing protein n=1 Tax=Terrimonas sp. TaxID=1914338 RepID=UPI000D5191D5|nr:IPT/TIG domain-containing protein [Terrimonas sp.]PVD53174.1 hypothetical protein DC498_04670 [Terrimonas sp.]